MTETAIAAKKKRRIKPPRPPGPVLAGLIVFGMIIVLGFWENTSIISPFEYWLIGTIIWTFRDWSYQSDPRDNSMIYPVRDKPIYVRVGYILLWPVTLFIDIYLCVMYLKDRYG